MDIIFVYHTTPLKQNLLSLQDNLVWSTKLIK